MTKNSITQLILLISETVEEVTPGGGRELLDLPPLSDGENLKLCVGVLNAIKKELTDATSQIPQIFFRS